jgi:type VI secretion system secreted protein VgrG
MALAQTQRLFSFDSPLGPNKLLVNSFGGSEHISELFSFQLELVSEDFNIDWDQIIDRNVTVGIRQKDSVSFRYFNGYINNFEPMRHEGRFAYYSAEMVPWLWYLTQCQDHLIYQEKTVPQVLELIFQKLGFRDYEIKKLGDRHQPWINCCQYAENAFVFVSRIMEAEGIYYWFKHEQGKHTMIIADTAASALPVPYQSTMKYEHETGNMARTEDTIFNLNMKKVIKPNQYAHKDYNFLIPGRQLYFKGPMNQFMGSNKPLEWFDYPADIDWPADAPDWGDLRKEEIAADRVTVTGNGNCRSMAPGYRFDLVQHDRADLDLNYLITKVTHHGHEGSLAAGSDAAEATYENSFSCIPSSIQYRPGRKTEPPNIGSMQTATVVGPKGEEIYTDEYARVKVHFHWDRRPADENSSCWIRVMQPIAGPGFGHIWLPRVGQEVVVQFLEGDPDRPVITGCLYNHVNHPPYTPVPKFKDWSGIKTRSTKQGKSTEFNELRFVDTKGDELYVMHAQKDMQITVENDTIEVVDRDRTLQVKRNQTEMVQADKHNTVKGNFNEDIQGQMSINVQKDVNEKAAGNFLLQAGGEVHIKAGVRIVLEAPNITFIGTGGFIDCTALGIAIQGTNVWLNCGIGSPTGAMGAMPQLPNIPSLPAGFSMSTLANMPNLPTMVSSLTSSVTGAVSGAVSGVTGAVSGAVSSVTGAVSGAISGAAGAVSGAVSGVTGAVSGAVSGVTGAVGSAVSGATGAVSGAVSGVTGAVSGATGAVSGAVSGVTGAVSGAVSGVTGAASSGLSSLQSSLASNPFVAPGTFSGELGSLSGQTPDLNSIVEGPLAGMSGAGVPSQGPGSTGATSSGASQDGDITEVLDALDEMDPSGQGSGPGSGGAGSVP